MTPAVHDYDYDALVVRVVDGDTFDVTIDLGLHVRLTDRIRVVGPDGRHFDAWEKRGEDRARGIEAWEYARTFAPEGANVLLRTHKDRQGKYGRWLAQVIHADTGYDLATMMVAAGHGSWNP